MPTTDTLDDAIRSLIAELMDASPPAPLLGDLDVVHSVSLPVSFAWRVRHPGRPRLLALIGGFGVACLAALLFVLVLPDPGPRIPVAEAAQLRLIATNAADQPQQKLGRSQWVLTEDELSYLASVSRVGSTPIVGAQAVVSATLDQWSNRFGESCTSTNLGKASFATPANRSAWLSLGLLDSPTSQPLKICVDVEGSTISNGESNVIDVSHLPTDPATLANQLETGTTGITQLDGIGSAIDSSSGLQRVATLLVEPTVGSSPSLTSALYNALSLMPGIHQLGQVATHSGASGLGFSADSPEGPRTIVVDLDTGGVLEIENIQIQSITFALLNVTSPFIGAHSPLAKEGASAGATIQWLDIGGRQSIVDTDQLPSGLNPTLPPIAVIKAVAKPDVPSGPLWALQQQLNARFGVPGGGYTYSAAPGGAVMYFSFSGSETQVNDFARALRASDLVASVNIDNGDN